MRHHGKRKQSGVDHHHRGRHRRARVMPAMADRRRRRCLNNPFDLAFDADGNLFFSDTFNHCIRRIDATHRRDLHDCRHRRARFFRRWRPGDRSAQLNEPYGVVVDRAGTIYFADRLNRRVRRIDAAGIITTLAGDGSGKYSGDGGPAAEAGLAEPNGLALDAAGERLFIADVADHRVRVVDLASGHHQHLRRHRRGAARRRWRPGDAGGRFRRARGGTCAGRLAVRDGTPGQQHAPRCATAIIETVAGTGARGYAGDGGDAREAVFDAPKEMAVDADGNVFIVDTENHAIR